MQNCFDHAEVFRCHSKQMLRITRRLLGQTHDTRPLSPVQKMLQFSGGVATEEQIPPVSVKNFAVSVPWLQRATACRNLRGRTVAAHVFLEQQLSMHRAKCHKRTSPTIRHLQRGDVSVQEYSCGANIEVKTEGNFSVPRDIPQYTFCQWTLRVPDGQKLQLEFRKNRIGRFLNRFVATCLKSKMLETLKHATVRQTIGFGFVLLIIVYRAKMIHTLPVTNQISNPSLGRAGQNVDLFVPVQNGFHMWQSTTIKHLRQHLIKVTYKMRKSTGRSDSVSNSVGLFERFLLMFIGRLPESSDQPCTHVVRIPLMKTIFVGRCPLPLPSELLSGDHLCRCEKRRHGI
ncbi:hypothetical protein CLF_106639 [Clonorchis sinensis]|uniref:CUB domain-containing protein n=1 Tax=Clonorchis sinensis TaxID=79923 RepID=G7YQ41_CLOSI|nr:hypothetical protein CLF_106639 [Clonorchis sinensis]